MPNRKKKLSLQGDTHEIKNYFNQEVLSFYLQGSTLNLTQYSKSYIQLSI